MITIMLIVIPITYAATNIGGNTNSNAVVIQTPTAPLNTSAINGSEKVRVSSADTTADYLYNKLLAGTGISLDIGSPAGDEDVVIENDAPDLLVSLTGEANEINVTGSYPNFKIRTFQPISTSSSVRFFEGIFDTGVYATNICYSNGTGCNLTTDLYVPYTNADRTINLNAQNVTGINHLTINSTDGNSVNTLVVQSKAGNTDSFVKFINSAGTTFAGVDSVSSNIWSTRYRIGFSGAGGEIANNYFYIPNTFMIAWANTSNTAPRDIGMIRDRKETLQINNATLNGYANLVLRNINVTQNITLSNVICNSTGTCYTLAQLNTTGGSGGNSSFNQTLTDSLYVPYTNATKNVDLNNKDLTNVKNFKSMLAEVGSTYNAFDVSQLFVKSEDALTSCSGTVDGCQYLMNEYVCALYYDDGCYAQTSCGGDLACSSYGEEDCETHSSVCNWDGICYNTGDCSSASPCTDYEGCSEVFGSCDGTIGEGDCSRIDVESGYCSYDYAQACTEQVEEDIKTITGQAGIGQTSPVFSCQDSSGNPNWSVSSDCLTTNSVYYMVWDKIIFPDVDTSYITEGSASDGNIGGVTVSASSRNFRFKTDGALGTSLNADTYHDTAVANNKAGGYKISNYASNLTLLLGIAEGKGTSSDWSFIISSARSLLGNAEGTKPLVIAGGNHTNLLNLPYLDIRADVVNMSKDLTVQGNITGNQIYGGMWYQNMTATSLNFASPDVYYQLYFTNATHLNGFSFQGGFGVGSNLTAQVSGVYQITYMAVGDGQNNHIYSTSVYINEINKPNCLSLHKMDAGGDIITQTGTCLLRINAGEKVSVRTADIGGTGTGNYYGGNIDLVRIGN